MGTQLQKSYDDAEELKIYKPDDIDDLVVWTIPCDDCGEIGCPYAYGEDRKNLEERIREIIHSREIEAREDEAAGVTTLPDGTLWSLHGDGKPLEKRLEELKQLKEQTEGANL